MTIIPQTTAHAFDFEVDSEQKFIGIFHSINLNFKFFNHSINYLITIELKAFSRVGKKNFESSN